ncbi:hypothetical protein H4582DRAFT_2100779 [Lactarius indigo]|nr:hypothetical protein H4582DRAFT_2100779 [Lactarius indigo]
MSPAKSSQVVVDEEMPLIHDSYAQRKPTPLPKTQLFLLLLVRLAELIMSQPINPTSTSDLSIVGGDKRKVGYYSRLLWSRVSNHTESKSILLLCPEGSVVPTILFGLSRSSRALFSSAPDLCSPPALSVSSYAMLDVAPMTLIPLVWVTPVELGGIDSDLNPTSIDMWMSRYGCLNGPVQFTSFPHVVARLGPGHVFLTSVLDTFSVDIQIIV